MYPLREDGWISLLQHLLELLISSRSPRWKQKDFVVSRTDAIAADADAIDFPSSYCAVALLLAEQ